MKKFYASIFLMTLIAFYSSLSAAGIQRFNVDDPAGRNTVTFKSEAPLEDIVGTTNKISGHIMFNPDNPGEGGFAELTVPVSSLNTGIPLRDEHLQSAGWLDAGAYPEIKLKLNKVVDSRILKETDSSKTFTVNVSGELNLHGVSRPVQMEARLSYLVENEKTKTRLPGNLLAVRTGFDVRLSDHNITGPEGMEIIGAKVGEVIRIEVSLVAGSVNP